MSNYGYTNADGEPIMDGAAYRYEGYIDSMSEPDPYDDYDSYDEPECEDDHACESCDGPRNPDDVWSCSWCERPCPEGAHAD